ncbi:MAG: PQQ-binding-like beta-propeller repeat protein, partial [Vicinamibacterales bacterium]
MTFSHGVRVLALAALVAVSLTVTAGQQPGPAGPYTTAQAAAGRTAYETSCAACHRPDLGGTNEAPQLAGGNFINTWGTRTTRDLFDYIQNTMPPAAPGSLSPATTADIIAYILQANGSIPGAQPLSPTSAIVIRSVAMAQAPQVQAPATAPAGPGRGQGAEAPGRGQGPGQQPPQPRRGITVTGEVRNFAPVTDAMLRNPDPGDWLMVRRNYQGWSHSPLAQVTRDNVQNLRLAWVWAMNEGGANQPMPLVHNGTMYLVNTGNIVQALDGRNGELIWEHRLGPEQGGAMRNLAIYQNNIFVTTTDARIAALDARTGKLVWESRIADPAKGYSAATGPIVINGKLVQGLNGCDRFKEDGCFISAFDAATGKLLWRFNTVARPDEPGGDTWGKQPMMFRGGGETWITGSYDPMLNLTYWGVAQPKPWVPASRGMTALDKALYTSSTVALNADTGKLAWYLQHAP